MNSGSVTLTRPKGQARIIPAARRWGTPSGTHTHPCVVCGDLVECHGYAVAHDGSGGGGRHCVREDDPTPVRCEACQDARTCHWCGAWFFPGDGRPRYPGMCSRLCYNEADEAAGPLAFDEAWPTRPAGV